MMYLPTCLVVVRLQLYILHSILWFYHFNETKSEEEKKKMADPKVQNWFVLLNYGHYMLALVSLLIIGRIFANIKYNWLFMYLNFLTSTILATTNVLVLIYKHNM